MIAAEQDNSSSVFCFEFNMAATSRQTVAHRVEPSWLLSHIHARFLTFFLRCAAPLPHTPTHSPFTWMEDYTAKSKWVGGRVGEDGKPLRCADALTAAMGELGFTVLEEGKVGRAVVGAQACERVFAGVCCSVALLGFGEGRVWTVLAMERGLMTGAAVMRSIYVSLPALLSRLVSAVVCFPCVSADPARHP